MAIFNSYVSLPEEDELPPLVFRSTQWLCSRLGETPLGHILLKAQLGTARNRGTEKMGPSGVDREKMELRHPNYSDFTMKSSGWVGNKAPKTWLVNIRKTQLTQGKIYGKHQETMIVTNKYKEGPVNCPTNSQETGTIFGRHDGIRPCFFLNMNYLARLLKQAEPTSLVNFLW